VVRRGSLFEHQRADFNKQTRDLRAEGQNQNGAGANRIAPAPPLLCGMAPLAQTADGTATVTSPSTLTVGVPSASACWSLPSRVWGIFAGQHCGPPRYAGWG